VPNEFDNVIMVAIVITCRANEKGEGERKSEKKKGESYGLCSLFTARRWRGLYDRCWQQYIITNAHTSTDSTCLLAKKERWGGGNYNVRSTITFF